MARLFYEELSGPFLGAFKAVHFAIFDDHNAHRDHNPQGNVLPFQQVFAAYHVRHRTLFASCEFHFSELCPSPLVWIVC